MTTPAESPVVQPAVDLAGSRYGRRKRPSRKALFIGVAVTTAVVLGFVYWVTVVERSKVTWQDNSFDVTSASEVLVTFDVQLHRGAKQAVCTVHALNPLNTEVGLRDVVVDGRDTRTGRIQMKVSIPTSEEATTGVVEQCVAK